VFDFSEKGDESGDVNLDQVEYFQALELSYRVRIGDEFQFNSSPRQKRIFDKSELFKLAAGIRLKLIYNDDTSLLDVPRQLAVEKLFCSEWT